MMKRSAELDESFALLLSQFDEELQEGFESHAPSETSKQIDGTLKQRLEPAQDFLRLLDSYLPRQKSAAEQIDTLEAPPHTIARFDIVRVVGRGGTGIVYLGHDPLLGRDVAIKVPRLEIVFTPDSRRRFLREAQAASLLNHPNIIPTLEVGESGAVCFIVYPYCRGSTLAQLLRNLGRPLPCPVAARLVERLADAMAHAHLRGVLHRDLKPSNILLDWPDQSSTQDGAGEVSQGAAHLIDGVTETRLAAAIPKITDFGLAKLMDADDITRTGGILGTPAYMSPEQSLDTKVLGPATDIWALGVVLYEVVTGQLPFQGPTPIEVTRAIRERSPISPRKLARVPKDLETICLKCLEKSPHRRYATAFDLAEDLSRFQRGEPIRARKAPAWERVWKWSGSNPATAALIGLMFLTLCGAATGTWFYIVQLERAVEASRREQAALQREIEANERSKSLASLVSREESFARRIRYVADVREAYQSIRDRNTNLVRSLMSRWTDVGGVDERGVEWYELSRQISSRPHRVVAPNLVTQSDAPLADKKKSLLAYAMSADCSLAAVARDGDIEIYDAKEWKKISTLPGIPEEKRVHLALAFSPDGKSLAAGYNRTYFGRRRPETTLWDLTTMKARARECYAEIPSGTSMDLAFSSDRSFLMVRTDRDLRFHSVAEYPKRVLALKNDAIAKAAFSKDGTMLAVANETTKSVEIRNLPSLTVRRSIPWDDAKNCEHLHFSPDGRFLAYASSGRIHLWELQHVDSQDLAGDLSNIPITSVAFSLNGEWLHLATAAKEIYTFSTQMRRRVAFDEVGLVTHIHCHPDGQRMFLRDPLGGIKVMDANWPATTETIDVQPSRLYAVAFSPDGRYFAAAGQAFRIHIYDAQTMQLQDVCNCSAEIFSLAFSTDSASLIAGDINGLIHRWNTSDWKELAPLKGHTDRVSTLAVCPDGKRLLSMGGDKTCRLWNLETDQVEHVFDGPFEGFAGMALSPDGKEFCWLGEEGSIRKWNLTTKTQRVVPSVTKGRAASYSGDGKWLATSSADGILFLWSTASDQGSQNANLHRRGSRSIAFSPNSKTLASAGIDQVVKIVDTSTFLVLATFECPGDELRAITWSPDGQTLVAAGHSGRLWIWRGKRPEGSPN